MYGLQHVPLLQVRLFDGQRVTRVSRSRELKQGDVLLIPRTLAPDFNNDVTGGTGLSHTTTHAIAPSTSGALPPAQEHGNVVPGLPTAVQQSGGVSRSVPGRQTRVSTPEAVVKEQHSRPHTASTKPEQGWLSWGEDAVGSTQLPGSSHPRQQQIQQQRRQQEQSTSGGSWVKPSQNALGSHGRASSSDDDRLSMQGERVDDEDGEEQLRHTAKHRSDSRSQSRRPSVNFSSRRPPEGQGTAVQRTAPTSSLLVASSRTHRSDSGAGTSDVLPQKPTGAPAVLPKLPVPRRYLLAPGAAHAGLLTAQEIQSSGVDLRSFVIGKGLTVFDVPEYQTWCCLLLLFVTGGVSTDNCCS
jgi:hypothetical protein